MIRPLLEREPTNPTYQRGLAIGLGDLGVTLRDGGQLTRRDDGREAGLRW